MNKENQIGDLMSSMIEKIKNIVDVDTIIGTPFETKEGVFLVPITKVSVGFVSGGGEYGCDKKLAKHLDKIPMAGGGGGGISISPIGFLEIKNKNCKLLKIDEKSAYQNVLEKIPSILESVCKIIDKGNKCNE